MKLFLHFRTKAGKKVAIAKEQNKSDSLINLENLLWNNSF